ncbi:hypothetical protein [Eisenibacter elegans]|jgi:hypothetical protein|uniref:gliding motility lipoprotein GldB n=1 Tax=Eisenibacter elegans TaxID=997 RepID=UPI0003F94DE7|nr:hypothetical protein [Eisenibacter elegans]
MRHQTTLSRYVRFGLFLGISLCLLTQTSCNNQDACQSDPALEAIPLNINIIRLENQLFADKSPQGLLQLLQAHPEFAREYLKEGKQIPDSVIVAVLSDMVNNPYLDTLYQDVRQAFADLSELEAELTLALKRVKQAFPDFNPPKIYTTITGLRAFYGNDLYVSPRLMVISLDFFLGETSRYRPPDMPLYIWKRYRKNYIVPTLMLALSAQFNQTEVQKDQTVLAEMIDYGKAYEFVKSVVPCTPDSIIAGYNSEEMLRLDQEENKKLMWSHFIERNVFYSTSQLTKSAYLNERPYVAEIGNKAPGRLGRWLGWKIVQKYRRKTKTSLAELMATQDAKALFIESGYKGE